MATLQSFKSSSSVRLLLIGDSGTGKTGALASLVEAGYKLYIIDFDNGLDYLAAHLQEKNPALLANVHFETFREEVKLVGDDIVPVNVPKAFAAAMKCIDTGIDGSGPLKNLGPDCVVVIDSLSLAGRAAFLHHKVLSPTKDPRQTYGGAQNMIMGLINNLTSESFKPHVIVNTHVSMVELENGTMKGLPAAIGKAVSVEIPKLFNRMLEVRQTGSGTAAKRVISTLPSALVNVKTGVVQSKLPSELPITTGLADFFKIVQGK